MRLDRMFPYLVGAAILDAVLVAAGVPAASLLPFALLLACPLMMLVMMRAMGSSHVDDHTGHGCQHDPTRTGQASEDQQR